MSISIIMHNFLTSLEVQKRCTDLMSEGYRGAGHEDGSGQNLSSDMTVGCGDVALD